MINRRRNPVSKASERELSPLNMFAGFAVYLGGLMVLMGAVGFMADSVFTHIST